MTKREQEPEKQIATLEQRLRKKELEIQLLKKYETIQISTGGDLSSLESSRHTAVVGTPFTYYQGIIPRPHHTLLVSTEDSSGFLGPLSLIRLFLSLALRWSDGRCCYAVTF